MQCEMEMCRNWTGQGCACAVLGVEPDIECPCCGADPNDTVCGSCGYHSCWAGELVCENYRTAETTDRAEYERRQAR